MALYAGIDLHSTNHVLVIIDEQDRVQYEKRLANDLEVTLNALTPFRDDLAGLALESTYNWYWLADGLIEAGFDVHLANTARMGEYGGLKYTDDKHDARWLAQMLRLGILPEGYILPKPQRADPHGAGIGRAHDGAPAEHQGYPRPRRRDDHHAVSRSERVTDADRFRNRRIENPRQAFDVVRR